MRRSVADRLEAVHPPNVARASLRGETALNFLAEVDLGSVLKRAIELTGWTNDRAGREMGYPDGSAVCRWVANREPVQIAKVWAVRQLRSGFLLALAERADADEGGDQDDIQITHTVTVRRRSVA